MLSQQLRPSSRRSWLVPSKWPHYGTDRRGPYGLSGASKSVLDLLDMQIVTSAFAYEHQELPWQALEAAAQWLAPSDEPVDGCATGSL